MTQEEKNILNRIENKIDLLLSSFSFKTKEGTVKTLLELFNGDEGVITLSESRKMDDYDDKLSELKKEYFGTENLPSDGIVVKNNREFCLSDKYKENK